MIIVGNKKINTTEITMAVMGAGAIIVGLALNYPYYALGVALSAPPAWILYRLQTRALSHLQGLSPHQATSRLLLHSFLRLAVQLALLGLSIFIGTAFLFGMLTGLLLQIITYTGQAVYVALGKEGKN